MLRSQVHIPYRYPEPHQPSPHPPKLLVWIHFEIIFHLLLVFPSARLPSGFITKILHVFLFFSLRSTCPAPLNFLHFNIPVFYEEYR